MAYKDIKTYIASFPAEKQKVLNKVNKLIRDHAPGAEEAMTYGVPTYKLNGQNLVHFAAFKNHLGFYPTPSGIKAFKEDLKPYKISTGTVRFPLDEPIPYDLMKKIVRFRVKELKE